ncbi:hypothetical protein SELMODRAFT_428527 [Selaginella moellendorffii]|uniref:EamA domain-containing protein n=1 Tax=Selaginella moellendorffii TaxID=88036 RepID=D8T350_SELML|nr:uncharacterized protein LOC9629874 [Selaginella moellendorffii]EFJ09041.1 hypothetical protein SELMODRAFT_428527 [Selaginella moellendorffii]|eukprot:XP_002990028.1 uncharacterized protein LOC9629874 [Selaginella moellendorffii]
MAENGDGIGTARPWYVLPVLVLAVFAISSAGAVTKLMRDAAPVSSAAWRLQATALILLPGFVWQWRWLPIEQRRRAYQCRIVVLSALALALHFGLWVWSLLHTSLPHSLLLVSIPPIILAVVSWLRCQPLSLGETFGIITGLLGVVIIAAMSRVENDAEVTLVGDCAAFLAACAFVIYMVSGSHLRAWMPLYIYVFPVTAGASIFLSLSCAFVDGETVPGYVSGPFGWFNKEFWFPVVFLALGPGFVGHTGLNAVLKYCSPLLVSMAVTLEPVFGSVVGWLLDVSPPPGISTCIGGALLVLGTIWVTYASQPKKSMQSAVANHPIDSQPLLSSLTKNDEPV